MRNYLFALFALTVLILTGVSVVNAQPAVLEIPVSTQPIATPIPNVPAVGPTLNDYYQLKKTNLSAAKNVLTAILALNPNNITAQKEMGYLLLSEKNPKAALLHFMQVKKLDPQDEQIAKQIAYLLNKPANQPPVSPEIKIKPAAVPAVAAAVIPIKKDVPKAPINFLNEFYRLRKINPQTAECALAQFLQANPNDVTAHKEMGYFLLQQKRTVEALCHFQVVQNLEPRDYKIALQIAYILNELGKPQYAYYQFDWAAQSCDTKDRKTAHQAMINLAGSQTKLFCDPYFADIYFAPFYLYRFRDTIYPGQFRFGRTFGKDKQVELYTTMYWTQDTQSIGGEAPAIYSDNAAVFAIGTRYKPFLKIPIYTYLEVGRAYYLVNQNKEAWESDIRLGITGYDNWGAKPEYTECWRFPFKPLGDVYGNLGYYSRFNHDWIGQLRVRQGLKLAEYGHSSIDGYLKAQIFFDTKHEFYNNVVEVGPGLAFIPDNRINLVLRVESLRGYYLPVNSPDPNPYGPRYTSNLVFLETYWRF